MNDLLLIRNCTLFPCLARPTEYHHELFWMLSKNTIRETNSSDLETAYVLRTVLDSLACSMDGKILLYF